jgi:hypothetical protein
VPIISTVHHLDITVVTFIEGVLIVRSKTFIDISRDYWVMILIRSLLEMFLDVGVGRRLSLSGNTSGSRVVLNQYQVLTSRKNST